MQRFAPAAGMEETMSATVWEGPRHRYAAAAAAEGPLPVIPSRSGRPHLVLVPTGDAVRDPEGGLHLTRRGKLVATALFLAASIGVGGFALPGPSAPAPSTHSVTVRPGQTLSEIAAAEMPGLTPAQGMTAIRVANELTTTTISAGQTLVIPTT